MHVIAIAGCSGSGKTTLASRLAATLASRNPLIIALDSYYRDYSTQPLAERERLNFDHPDAIEAELLVKHLHDLINGRPAQIPAYDFATHSRRPESVKAIPSDIIIIEGIHALYWPDVRILCQQMIFIETPLTTCFERRFLRDQQERQRTPDSILAQWQETVEPMFKQYALSTAQFATLRISDNVDSRENEIISRIPPARDSGK